MPPEELDYLTFQSADDVARDIMVEKHKAIIDKMSQEEMAVLWRYARVGHPYFNRDLPLYDYFKERFDSLGGMTPEISKRIGWKGV